jgi:hypothetical protein
MATSTIAKISARAKSIRRAHPKMEWQACLQQASREYRSGSLGAAPKKKARKKAAPKKKTATRKRAAPKKRATARRRATNTTTTIRKPVVTTLRTSSRKVVAGVTPAQLKRAYVCDQEDKLSKKLLQRTKARTKRDRNKINKEIVAINKKLRLANQL